MRRGVRWIDGREFLLCGRESSREDAERAKKTLRDSWERVRIVKLNNWDFMLYVHGGRPTSRLS
jgi:hypothetical protein